MTACGLVQVLCFPAELVLSCARARASIPRGFCGVCPLGSAVVFLINACVSGARRVGSGVGGVRALSRQECPAHVTFRCCRAACVSSCGCRGTTPPPPRTALMALTLPCRRLAVWAARGRWWVMSGAVVRCGVPCRVCVNSSCAGVCSPRTLHVCACFCEGARASPTAACMSIAICSLVCCRMKVLGAASLSRGTPCRVLDWLQ